MHLRQSLGLGVLVAMGCSGGAMMRDTARVVPASVPELSTSSFCQARLSGERLLAVSPEGDLWLSRPANGAQMVRVIDPDGSVREELRALGRVDQAIAFDGESLVVHAEGHVLATGAGRALEEVPFPAGGTLRSLCGDPLRDGSFLLTDRLLGRAVDRWWEWDSQHDGFAEGLSWINVSDGACRDAAGSMWVGTGGGRLLELSQDGAFREVLPRDVLLEVATHPDWGVAARGLLGSLYLGSAEVGFERVEFASGAATQIIGAGNSLWVRAGGQLYRYAKDEFRRVLPPNAEAPLPYAAGGLWIEADEEFCHHSMGPLLRVSGIRPNQPVTIVEPFEVNSDAAGQLEVFVDSEPFMNVDGSGSWQVPALGLNTPGHHQVSLRLDSHERSFGVEIIDRSGGTFEDDIRPLFERHCAGASCHGPGPDSSERPDLSTYAGWIGAANAIEQRVLFRGDMPPLSARRPDWNPDSVATIQRWFDGGAREQ